jgi:hypothetical protein
MGFNSGFKGLKLIDGVRCYTKHLYVYFHSILSYGIIFCGNSAYSSNIFKIQKRIIRIIMRGSCRQLFRNLKILPLKSQYIFSLLLFVAENRDLYESNSEIHNINTRFSSELHTLTAKLTAFQKGPFYLGTKFFNHLPTSIKKTSYDIYEFRFVLKSFLIINSFYSLEEYFTWQLKVLSVYHINILTPFTILTGYMFRLITAIFRPTL